ncbi:ATP-binding protein [Actinomadura fibrosa]|uniref:ATP-binding protein n=1 Tax=Actinomadura fibrosa TaxID=111802 RepID=A0ABW2XGT1_9ACTN|nr:ATP-binding protein [Actinomadura fibrosa]
MIVVTRLSRLFAGQPESISHARAFTRTFVFERVPDELFRAVELVVSELCTNAVEHTASGEEGGHFVLELELHGDHVRVSVIDFGSPSPPIVNDEPAGTEAVRGRGLFIVEAFSRLGEANRCESGDGSGRTSSAHQCERAADTAPSAAPAHCQLLNWS